MDACLPEAGYISPRDTTLLFPSVPTLEQFDTEVLIWMGPGGERTQMPETDQKVTCLIRRTPEGEEGKPTKWA